MKKIKLELECYGPWNIIDHKDIKKEYIVQIILEDATVSIKKRIILESSNSKIIGICSTKIFGLCYNKKIKKKYEEL